MEGTTNIKSSEFILELETRLRQLDHSQPSIE